MSAGSFALLLFAIACAVCGQLLLKHGMRTAVERAESSGGSLVGSAATSPWILLGLTVFGISAVAWMATLARVPLSVAYPFNALSYLAILTASVVVLHEKTNVWTWVGTTCVVVGLVVVVLTKP